MTEYLILSLKLIDIKDQNNLLCRDALSNLEIQFRAEFLAGGLLPQKILEMLVCYSKLRLRRNISYHKFNEISRSKELIDKTSRDTV